MLTSSQAEAMAIPTSPTVLLTGATGFFGSRLAEHLVRKGCTLLCLIRDSGSQKQAALQHSLSALNPSASVHYLEGDITREKVLSTAADTKHLNKVTHCIHAAALTTRTAGEDALTSVNVFGTANMLSLAKSLPKLKRFSHISSASISGTFEGIFFEEDQDKGQDFNDALERSKFVAERLVSAAQRTMPISIVRPVTLVDEGSSLGPRPPHSPFLALLELFAKMAGWQKSCKIPLPVSLASSEIFLPILPVSFAAELTTRLTLDPESQNRTYCLADPFPPTLREAYALLRQIHGLPHPLVTCNPAWLFTAEKIPGLRKLLDSALSKTSMGLPEVERLFTRVEYDCSNTEDYMQAQNMSFPPLRGFMPAVVAGARPGSAAV